MCKYVKSVYFMFLILIIRYFGGTSSLKLCEKEGICIIHDTETMFSCGSRDEVLTKYDFPEDYFSVMDCLKGKRKILFKNITHQYSCYRNGTWYNTQISQDSVKQLRYRAESISIPGALGYCISKSPEMMSKFVSIRFYGGIIHHGMNLDGNHIVNQIVEEIALDNNYIKAVSNDWFSGMVRLRSLSLTYNPITVIEKCFLPVSGTVILFNISNTDLDCCSVLHLKHWEAYWGENVVYGECKVDDKMKNFADDFTGQCIDGGHFDCIDIGITTQTSSRTETGFEEFLKTLGLIGLGASLTVATMVTACTLKLVHRRTRTISNERGNKVNVNEKNESFIEHHLSEAMESKERPDNNVLMTYQSNNVPPIEHRFNVHVVFSTRFHRRQMSDNVDYQHIDSLPYTAQGNLDLSCV